jgi:glucosyl-dolichyl phosphate glucuronosyltransferase
MSAVSAEELAMTARVSVIIPTKNRAVDLERTIETLLMQTVKPFEIIVIDQSASPSFTKRLPIPMQYIHDCSLSGASAARNVGMHGAQGDVWLFLDDDVVLEANFIEEILRTYRANVTGISGIITNYSMPPLRQRMWEKIFQRGPFQDERQIVYRNVSRHSRAGCIPVRFFGAGLMSFRAEAIREHQFDPHLTGPSPGEDVDFCLRLPKGSTLLINPRARLIHNRSAENRNSSHWLSVQSQVAYYLRERHWRSGIRNNICFAWLKVGYAMLATYSLLRSGSSEAWRAWRAGAKRGRELAAL